MRVRPVERVKLWGNKSIRPYDICVAHVFGSPKGITKNIRGPAIVYIKRHENRRDGEPDKRSINGRTPARLIIYSDQNLIIAGDTSRTLKT